MLIHNILGDQLKKPHFAVTLRYYFYLSHRTQETVIVILVGLTSWRFSRTGTFLLANPIYHYMVYNCVGGANSNARETVLERSKRVNLTPRYE